MYRTNRFKEKQEIFGFTKEVLYISFLVLKEKKQNKVRTEK